MIKEFIHLSALLENLNKNHHILKDKEIEEIKNNTIKFMQTKNELVQHMNKLASINLTDVEKIIALRLPNTAGPISHILHHIDLCLISYEWQLYQMRDFLFPLVKYYKQKAKNNNCIKEKTRANPIKKHYKIDCISNIPEIEDLIVLLETHNNYLGENKVLSIKEINHGYRYAKEVSVLNCDIQYLLHQLESTSPNDICKIDILLRSLHGKILVCAKYIRLIIQKNLEIMFRYYPDWGHIVD